MNRQAMWEAIGVLQAGTRPHFVYFVTADGPRTVVKIGTTTDVDSRMNALRRDDTKRPEWVNPESLRLIGWVLGDHELERLLHRAFADERVIGEWFDYEAIREQIDDVLCHNCQCSLCQYGVDGRHGLDLIPRRETM